MNMKDNLIFFFCFFPIFAIKSNFENDELFLVFAFYVLLIVLNIKIFNFLKNKKKIYKNVYLSFIITVGLDNHLGLFYGLIQSNVVFFLKHFTIIYIPALIILIFIFLIITALYFFANHKKISQIFLVTIIALFLFSVFDNTKSYKKVPFFEKEVSREFDNTTLVIIWDEMSGFNSLSSKTFNGKIVDQNFKKLFEKYKFNYHTKAFTISDNSVGSITSLINYNENIDIIDKSFVEESENYFSEYEIKKNLFFNRFKSISVIQNIHINYCNKSNVFKCYQYNPLNLKILNSDVDALSNIISAWSLNGSIIGKFIWRFLKQFGFISSTLEPEGEKLFIKEILDYGKKDLFSKKFDLIFMHLLVPHKPYGFNSNCKYDVRLSNLNIYLDKNKSIQQHNIERNCVISLMDVFFREIKNLSNYEIFIISDHGSRITKEDSSSLSAIFAYKDFKNDTSINYPNKESIQSLFKKLNYE